MSRHRLIIALAAICTLGLVFVPLTASGQDAGRPPGASPGPAVAEQPDPGPEPSPAWDGDGPAPRTLVHSGDSTIQGGLCVGFDCASNEPMGFATIKIEENNLRIAAADSSSVSGFPTTDWQIEFNSSSSGGGNYFMVRDCGSGGAAGSVDSTCGGTPMLTIEGGADNESIHVDSSGNQGGNVGFGTATPVVDLHALSGNTPTLRLEQDNSSGFTPQSWDMAGNESNFFIRDVTNGSALPFRIEPGVASNTLYLDNLERIGFGTTAPASGLHLRTTVAGSTGANHTEGRLTLENVSGTEGNRDLLRMANNGALQIRMVDTSADGETWVWGTQSDADYQLDLLSTGAASDFVFERDGDLTLNFGMVNSLSDVNSKENFAPVDAADVLAKVAALDISTWNYRHNDSSVRHIGPTAQDFSRTFGLGADDRSIGMADLDGVALAAIQALHAQNQELLERISSLEAQLAGS